MKFTQVYKSNDNTQTTQSYSFTFKTSSEMNWFKKNWFLSVAPFETSLISSTDNSVAHSRMSNEFADIYHFSLSELKTLKTRRTTRRFDGKTLEYSNMASSLVRVSEFINGDKSQKINPFSFVFIIYDVDGFENGIYAFDISSGKLILANAGEFRGVMSSIIQGLSAPLTANFSVLICIDYSDVDGVIRKHDSIRETYFLAGWIAQKLIMTFAESGLACLPTPALSDDFVDNLCGHTTPFMTAIYSLTFGIRSDNTKVGS